jgi:uncharacterized SAM-binding protein YcdF (DUF218 family)
MRGIVAVVGLVVIVPVAGFVAFARDVAGARAPTDPTAEGIVVLTGGSARIDGALRLLAEGRATRLLISGVNPTVNRATLAGQLEPDLAAKLACCADLGRAARDTVGNAAETRTWAESQGFSSLIVVTSDYHMRRSMAELADAMPDVGLIAYPVTNPDLHLSDWWRRPPAAAVLLREYVKYLLTTIRLAFSFPAAGGDGGAVPGAGVPP